MSEAQFQVLSPSWLRGVRAAIVAYEKEVPGSAGRQGLSLSELLDDAQRDLLGFVNRPMRNPKNYLIHLHRISALLMEACESVEKMHGTEARNPIQEQQGDPVSEEAAQMSLFLSSASSYSRNAGHTDVPERHVRIPGVEERGRPPLPAPTMDLPGNKEIWGDSLGSTPPKLV